MGTLDRRGFLTTSLAGTGAVAAIGLTTGGLGATGCAHGALPPELAGRDLESLSARLTRGLTLARDAGPEALGRHVPRFRPDPAKERVLRATLASMVVTDVARSVPEDASLPRGFAGQLAQALPWVSHSASLHHDVLTRMPDADRRAIGAHVRARPHTVTDVAGWIDEHAATLGVARSSRLKLRAAAADVGVKLRRQSASAVIDDAIAKVERAVAQGGSSLSAQRSLMVASLLDALRQDGGGAAGGLAVPGSYLEPAAEAAVNAPDSDEAWRAFLRSRDSGRWSAHWGRPGDEERQIGLVMMPFGALSCALLTIIGLIVLIAGLVQNGDWDGTPRASEG